MKKIRTIKNYEFDFYDIWYPSIKRYKPIDVVSRHHNTVYSRPGNKFAKNNPLKGKNVCLSGDFYCDRNQLAEKYANLLGCNIKHGNCKSLDIVICGYTEIGRWVPGFKGIRYRYDDIEEYLIEEGFY